MKMLVGTQCSGMLPVSFKFANLDLGFFVVARLSYTRDLNKNLNLDNPRFYKLRLRAGGAITSQHCWFREAFRDFF